MPRAHDCRDVAARISAACAFDCFAYRLTGQDKISDCMSRTADLAADVVWVVVHFSLPSVVVGSDDRSCLRSTAAPKKYQNLPEWLFWYF
jgi:hypothetical protein